MSGIDVARVVKKLTVRAGLDPFEVRGPFATGRSCDGCGHCWGNGAVDHETDGASERADGPAVYPRRKLVPGKLSGQVGVVNPKSHGLYPLVVRIATDLKCSRKSLYLLEEQSSL